MFDNLVVYQDTVTKTADFTGAAVKTLYGTPVTGMFICVDVTAYSGLDSLIFTVSGGATSGGTFYNMANNIEGPITGIGRYYVPFNDNWDFHKIAVDVTGTGSVTYTAKGTPTRP